MNLAYRKPMTLPEFLEWEERQELKHEFDGIQPVAMTGGTAAHSAIQGNLAAALKSRLRGSPCQFFGSDLKIEVAGRIRYPDGFVVLLTRAELRQVVSDPVIIFEVLSESTSATDRILKNREYQATPSVQRYVILEQDRIAATVFARTDGDWVGHVFVDDAVLGMPEIGHDIPLSEFYEGLAFEDLEAVANGDTPPP